jgi:hypothetical protein
MWTKIKKWIQKILPSNSELDKYALVYQTTEAHLAELMKAKLRADGLHVFAINKQDSSYNNFGSIEIYVEKEYLVRAKYLIEKQVDE